MTVRFVCTKCVYFMMLSLLFACSVSSYLSLCLWIASASCVWINNNNSTKHCRRLKCESKKANNMTTHLQIRVFLDRGGTPVDHWVEVWSAECWTLSPACLSPRASVVCAGCGTRWTLPAGAASSAAYCWSTGLPTTDESSQSTSTTANQRPSCTTTLLTSKETMTIVI